MIQKEHLAHLIDKQEEKLIFFKKVLDKMSKSP